MRFRFVPRSMTLDDLELHEVRILGEFCVISQTWRQQRLHEWRETRIVMDIIGVH